MSEFRPIFSAHAIERCSVSLTYGSALPDKLFANVIRRLVPHFEDLGFKRQAGSGAFQIDSATGKLIAVADDYAPATFESHDKAYEIIVMPNMLVFASQRYVRWASFINAFFTLSGPVLAHFDEVTSIGSVRLEYWDRFIWTGDWSDFELRQLIRDDTRYVSAQLFQAKRERHSHNGWFEYLEGERRLFNVNIDVTAFSSSPQNSRIDPSVGIYILIQDQAELERVKSFTSIDVNERLQKLHRDSKNMLSNLLLEAHSNRIGLGG